jgi:hypothetical protein
MAATRSRPGRKLNPDLRRKRRTQPVHRPFKIQNGGASLTDPNHEIARLSSRISALEKANRRWKTGGLFLFIFLVGAAFLTGFKAYAQRGTASDVAKTVVAQEFVLMGPHGHARGRMTVVHGKPALQFYNSAGELWWYAPPKMGVVPVKVK